MRGKETDEIFTYGEYEKPHRLKRILKLGTKAIAIGMLTSTVAAGIGLKTARVNDYLGASKTRFSYTFDDESHLDTGLGGILDMPFTRYGLGMTAQVHGIPVENVEGDGQESTLVSETTLKQYANLYSSPNTSFGGVEELLRKDALHKALYAEIALLALLMLAQRKLSVEDKKKIKSFSGFVAAGALAFSGTYVYNVHEALPNQASVLHELDGTPFAGSSSNDEPMRSIIESIGPDLAQMYRSEFEAAATYTATAIASLNSQKDLLATAGPDEILIDGISDLHCSDVMTPVWTDAAAITAPNIFFSDGDNVDGGTAAEDSCVVAEANIAPDADKVDADGNHDSPLTEQEMKENGFVTLNGQTVYVDHVSFLGDDDPVRTKFLSADEYERDETNTQMSERLLTKALKDHPNSINVHEPEAAEAIVAHIRAGNPYLTSLVTWGHTHHRVGPEVVWNTDGTWTVICQMGTAGGYGPGTLTTINTPESTPTTSAEEITWIMNAKSKLITGYQIVSFDTQGIAYPGPIVRVGTPDGMPRVQPGSGDNDSQKPLSSTLSPNQSH